MFNVKSRATVTQYVAPVNSAGRGAVRGGWQLLYLYVQHTRSHGQRVDCAGTVQVESKTRLVKLLQDTTTRAQHGGSITSAGVHVLPTARVSL